VLKDFLATAWSRLGPVAPGLAAPILCYHSINDADEPQWDPLPSALFESHLKHLRANYNVVPLEMLTASLLEGAPLPPKPVVITFDDGYRDNYEVAFPLLKRYETPATIYVVTDFLNGEISLIPDPIWDAMTWEQAREMADSGLVEFGAHTCTHRFLTDLDDRAVRDEILLSRDQIEWRLGRPVKSFAYPNGQGADIPASALATVREAGFTNACSTFWRSRNTPAQRYLLNRVMIARGDTVEVLENKLRGDYDYLYVWHKARAFYSANILGRGIWR